MNITVSPVNIYTSPTLLPENIANLITAVALATRLSIRCSSLLIEALIESIKYSTLFSFGTSRHFILNALSTAKRLHELAIHDHSNRLQVLDKYTNLGIYIIHHSLTLVELFTLSGLQFTGQAIKSGFMAAEESVAIIDGIFGSNDSSRAIASIITLVHRELTKDPDFKLADAGKTAIISGLTKAVTSFAILQNFTHKKSMNQMGIIELWKGIVVEQEKNEKSTLESKGDPDLIRELETILSSSTADEKASSQNYNLHYNQKGEHYRLYEISTNTKRTITKTIKIRPIDIEGNQCTPTKKIYEKTHKEEDESFMAVVNSHNEKNSGFKVMLASVSKILARKKIERQESFDNTPHNEGPVTTISSSLTTQKSSKTSHQQDNISSQLEHGNTKKQSWILDRKKSMSNLIQMGTLPFSSKKSPSDSPPPLPTLKRSDSSQSTTSRTLKTITYTTDSSDSSQHTLLDKEPYFGNFPRKHIITNIAHFIRYASAAYGESFMRIMGIGDIPSVLPNSYHPNHHAFAHHTRVSVNDILLSSYTDHDSILNTVSHTKLHALVHYVTVDHFSEAIVLTCRGTLGLSDILTDLTCDYKKFQLPSDTSKQYVAHGGMLEAAQLLATQKGKVFEAIRHGLELYPGYGLVVCGHSLGAGVASLLSILWSEKRDRFVTSEFSGLPSGRPMHCYTFGSPCVMSLALSDYCGQGLVTSVVHGVDIVSSLSLGLLKDFKNIAVSLYEESHVADEILSRIMDHYRKKKANEITPEQEENDQWFWALIKTMRADMNAEKLFPPSNVYLIESVPQLAQHSHSQSQTKLGNKQESKHKIAHMVRFNQCKDIQARFSEIVFSRTMFLDHSPKMYEKSIELLNKGYFA